MKHASLFSGIGGFDLAAAWMGWENIFQVEKDQFCNRVLSAHFPEVKRYNDIKSFNAQLYEGAIDVVSAGFPCQPFSVSGRRKGTGDDRYLWPETIRVIREIRPSWIVLENVTGLLSILEAESISSLEITEAELFGENIHKQEEEKELKVQRRIIGRIINEIRAAGYLLPTLSDTTPVILCIPAVAVGAVHRRDRIWIVAYSDGHGNNRKKPTPISDQRRHDQIDGENRPGQPGRFGTSSEGRVTSDTNSPGLEGSKAPGDFKAERQKPIQHPAGLFKFVGWNNWPTEPPICRGNDGVSHQLDTITFSKWRKESIKAFGNAIVPRVAFEIFTAIAESSHPR